MAKLPEVIDPTLAAMDAALSKIERENAWDSTYLGVSSIGKSCLRQGWYKFRWATLGVIDDPESIKRLEDGNACESIMARRLRYVAGIDLYQFDTETGKQFGVEFLGGHLRGRVDGVIEGLHQAPKTAHAWEHKSVKETDFKKLAKLKREKGEKNALKLWRIEYFSSAQLYMNGLGLERHYMTVTTPGARNDQSVRTDIDPIEAGKLLSFGEAIVFADKAPPRLSQDPEYFECKWCQAFAVCHGNNLARSHCRSCLHSTAERDGTWSCARFNKTLSLTDQREGCPAHLFLPEMVPGSMTSANHEEEWVEYSLRNGMIWRDGVKHE